MLLDKFLLEGQVCIVTGGGRGLGRVFCLAFAEVGADVVVAEVDPKTGVAVADEIRALGRRALFVETDVRCRESVEAMVVATLKEFGQIDVLVNNAGISRWGAAVDVLETDWRNVLDVNLNGVFFCCQAVGRHMVERRAGRVINIASMSGFVVNRPQAQLSYNTTKAAVVHLTRSLAVEWAPYGVRVNAIAPGYMATELVEEFFDQPEYGGTWIEAIPMKRPGRPEELAPLAIYLASEASSYVTGVTMVIDGGYTLW